MKPIMFYLGLCSGYWPDNYQFSVDECFMEAEAKNRAVEVKEDFDDFERAYFSWEIKRVIGTIESQSMTASLQQ